MKTLVNAKSAVDFVNFAISLHGSAMKSPFFRPLWERAVMADLPEQIQIKTFTEVTAPKSRMSTNSITGAYSKK